MIEALRANGIEVTGLDSHMLDVEPRPFFMHFRANDAAGKLAKGLRDALNTNEALAETCTIWAHANGCSDFSVEIRS